MLAGKRNILKVQGCFVAKQPCTKYNPLQLITVIGNIVVQDSRLIMMIMQSTRV